MQSPSGPEDEEEEEEQEQPVFKRARLTGKIDLTALFPGGVVIVDDDPMARVATKGALRARYGVTVQAHSSAQDFLDNMFRPPPLDGAGGGAAACQQRDQPRCLILMDHLMPVMDGEQVLDHIPVGHPHIIVMISGTYFRKEDRERIGAKGVSAFFEKPLEWRIFDDVVDEVARS